MSTIVIVALFFFAFLAVIAIMIWIDRKTTYIVPGKFNYNDGRSEKIGEQSDADHQENRKTGEIMAKASAPANGNASAVAELGFEYENPATQPVKLVVEVSYEYQISIKAESGQSKVQGKVETVVNSKSATIASASYPASESAAKPATGGLKKGSKRHSITLQPGEGFKAYLKFSTEAEAADTGLCVSQINGKLTEVSYRPEIALK